jgi:coenzyme Q-binding protein COQ10
MVKTKVTVDAPLSVLWEVVTDIVKYPEFIKEMKNVRIEKTDGAKKTAIFEVDLIKTISYTLTLTEEKPKRYYWNLVKGQFMTRNDGSWDFTEEGPEKSSAVYAVDVKFGLLVPSSITNMITEVNLPKMMDAFKKRSEGLWQQRKAAGGKKG